MSLDQQYEYRRKLTNMVLSAIGEIEQLIDSVHMENTPNQSNYILTKEHSMLIESTADQVLNELERLKGRI